VAVSADDPRPPYLQVADAIRADIAAGTLRPDQRLRSGRELAEEHGVALMTVQKALAMLRDEHVLVTRQGHGTFVAPGGAEPAPPSPEFVEISRQLGELRELIKHTAESLGERLSALERSADPSPEVPRSRSRRD
jgi:DNA-binding GntR family transcriptional regulator